MQNAWSNNGALKALLDRLPAAAYLSLQAPGARPLHINPAMEQLLGHRLDDFTKTPSYWAELIAPEDRDRVEEVRLQLEAGNDIREVSYSITTADDRRVNVVEQMRLLDGADHAGPYRLGIITALSGQTDSPRDSQALDPTCRLVVEQTSDLVVKTAPDGRCLFVSPSYCALFGKTEEELLGQKIRPLVHEEDRGATEQAMQALLQPPHKAHFEQRAMTRFGWRWLAWTDNAIVNAHGEIIAIIGVGLDITESRRIADALKTSEHRLHAILHYASIGYWELSKDGQTEIWSDEIYQIFGLHRSTRAGSETLQKLVHPEDWIAVHRSLSESLESGREHHVDYRIRKPDGEQRWIACRAKPRFEEGSQIDRLSGFIQDITEQKRIEAAIRRNEQRFRLVATTTNDLIYEWEVSGNALHWYGDVDRALGYAPGNFARTINAWIEAIHPDDRSKVKAAVERIRYDGGSVDVVYRICAADGSWRVWQDKGQTLQDEDGNTVSLIGGCTDITARKQAEEKVQHLAFHDPLTGLPNRLLFREELSHALERLHRDGNRFALHYLDLDHFKDINDSLGHQFGDELLRSVADRIGHMTRSVDLFSRLGGDEFALIQSEVHDASEASILAIKILDTIGEEFRLLGRTVHINTSIGIVVADEQEGAERLDADDLLKRADTALYKAKDAGRGTYAFFHDYMTAQLQQELELVTALAMAIYNEELFIEYQPQYQIGTRRLIGLEALVRWRHPRYGELLPERFLPAAEKRGLGRDISDWVLMTACAQGAEWLQQGLRFGRMAINLSAMQVDSDDFFTRVLRTIELTGIAPENLELEFTETVLMQASEKSKEAVTRLSDLGVDFAIDDFGTGFSSLSYLKNFHADKIKIDQEFVRDVTGEQNDAEIVKATIALGRSLGLTTLAEGVEHTDQLSFLEANGCDQAQGFLFCRPLSASGIEEMLRRVSAKRYHTQDIDGIA